MNRLTVLTVGTKQASWAREAEREYCRRLANWKAQVIAVRAGQGANARNVEGERLWGMVPAGSTPVACVAGTGDPSSEELAARMPGWLGDGGVTFLIGNHHGLDTGLLTRIRERLSLSRLTMAQDIARVVLLEQCYRCMCILGGHPYHAGHGQ